MCQEARSGYHTWNRSLNISASSWTIKGKGQWREGTHSGKGKEAKRTKCEWMCGLPTVPETEYRKNFMENWKRLACTFHVELHCLLFTSSSWHPDSMDMLKTIRNRHSEVNRLILHRRVKSIAPNRRHFPTLLMFPKRHVFAKFSPLSLSSGPMSLLLLQQSLGGHDDKPMTAYEDSTCVRFMLIPNFWPLAKKSNRVWVCGTARA